MTTLEMLKAVSDGVMSFSRDQIAFLGDVGGTISHVIGVSILV